MTTWANLDALLDALGESDAHARNVFGPVLLHFGMARCAAIYDEACDVEAMGGLWSVKTRARRTKGGVFLALLKARYPEAAALLSRDSDRSRNRRERRRVKAQEQASTTTHDGAATRQARS